LTRRFRFAVIGAGGIGSAAAYWLSRVAGEDVVCLEQWTLGHGKGASEDHSRIIRLGYHASRYTALTREAYAAWELAERESGVSLVQKTGMVNLARPGTDGGSILANYERAMSEQDIAYERLEASEVMRRWPQFRLDGDQALFQPDGGILDIRKGVAVHLALARGHGATVLSNAEVTAIEDTGDGVRLTTTAGDFEVERVVLCAGAWTARLLETQLGVSWPIRLTQEQVTYFATPSLRAFAADRFPIWIWHGDEEEFYGFPVHGEVATKAAKEVCGAAVTLDARSWEPDRERVRRVAEFVEGILPGYGGPELYTRCCLYDMPPDRDFVIDRLPGHPSIAVCIGAGHAAKFAALLGRILSELSIDGATDFPIEAFRADRPALVDPSYPATYRLGGPPVAAV